MHKPKLPRTLQQVHLHIHYTAVHWVPHSKRLLQHQNRPIRPSLGCQKQWEYSWGIYLSGECEHCVSVGYCLLHGDNRHLNNSCNLSFQCLEDTRAVLLWDEICCEWNVGELAEMWKDQFDQYDQRNMERSHACKHCVSEGSHRHLLHSGTDLNLNHSLQILDPHCCETEMWANQSVWMIIYLQASWHICPHRVLLQTLKRCWIGEFPW